MITFDPLWRTLKAKGLNKTELQKKTQLSSTTIAKLAKNEVVKLDVVDRICEALNCPISDVVEIVSSGSAVDNKRDKSEQQRNRRHDPTQPSPSGLPG